MKLLFWKGRTNKTAFRARFREALLARFPMISCEFVAPLDLQVTGLPQWSTATLNLERAYGEFCDNPAEFPAIVERWAGAIDPANHANSLDQAALTFLRGFWIED